MNKEIEDYIKSLEEFYEQNVKEVIDYDRSECKSTYISEEDFDDYEKELIDSFNSGIKIEHTPPETIAKYTAIARHQWLQIIINNKQI